MESLNAWKVFILLLGLIVLCQAKVPFRNKRQIGTGITFAIPGLNLLQGNFGGNSNAGGNLFGMRTFTRTIVSTVATVTTASFRTCTTSAAALTACAGRRRRDAADDLSNIGDDLSNAIVEPTPVMQLIVGTTTISDPIAVSEYLDAHKLSSQSVIYPDNFDPSTLTGSEYEDSSTTILYPSGDLQTSDDVDATTEYPIDDQQQSGTQPTPEKDESVDKARLGLGQTTTVTTIIRVTSVATTIASGTMATLSITYAGCLPNSLPVSGLSC